MVFMLRACRPPPPDPEYRFGHPVAGVNVDLPPAEADFCAGLTGDFRQGDRGRRFEGLRFDPSRQ